MIDLDSQQLNLVRRLVREYFPDCEARVFGSRVNGTAKPWSDLDVVIVSGEKLPRAKLQLLREALQAAPLTVRVEVQDWRAVAGEFQRVVGEGFEVL
ncbi:MAG: nucleotidyltransferase domain-containing protein [Verrucomicrobiales bacterium]|jgi:predicted nucleotidyltransferase|nr:nucleotidyltransferase domain-containing protein [Verrucomicrobiales bacterium]